MDSRDATVPQGMGPRETMLWCHLPLQHPCPGQNLAHDWSWGELCRMVPMPSLARACGPVGHLTPVHKLAWGGLRPCMCSAYKPCPCCLQAPLPPLPPTLTSLWLLSLHPQPPAPLHSTLPSPLLSTLLQTMAICIIRILSTLNLLQLTLKVGDQVDVVMKDLMQQ